MKRAMVLCGVILLVASTSYAVNNYTFIGTRFSEVNGGANFDNALNWNPGYTAPGTSLDNFTWNTAYLASTKLSLASPGAGKTRWFGGLYMTGAYQYLASAASASGTYRFAADNGCTGSLVITGANGYIGISAASQGSVTFDMDGDFIENPSTGGTTNGLQNCNVIMRGRYAQHGGPTYQTYSVNNYTETYNHVNSVIVDNGARINFAQPVGNYNCMRALDVWGTAKGTVLVSINPTSQRIFTHASSNTDNLNVNYQDYYQDGWTNAGSYYTGTGKIAGGKFLDVSWGQWAWSTANWKLVGALQGNLQAKDLYVLKNSYNPTLIQEHLLSTSDNGTGLRGNIYNITVDCDLQLGNNASARPNRGILKLNSATVDIGHDLLVQQNKAPWTTYPHTSSYLLGDTGLLKVGGNLTIDNGVAAVNDGWNMGTSTLMFTGKTRSLQTVQTKGAPFYNVTLNSPGGLVSLVDNITLKGNFRDQFGVLRTNSNFLVMQGGQGTWASAETFQMDNASGAVGRLYVKQGSPTWVKLLSNLTVNDNIDVEQNCLLFTNGYTLTVNGGLDKGTFGPSSAAYQTREGGFILVTGVPEPATLLLLGSGAAGFVGWMRRRRVK